MLTISEKPVWITKSQSILRERKQLLAMALYLGEQEGGIRVYLPQSAQLKVGDIVLVAPEEMYVDNRRVLYAKDLRLVQPPQTTDD